MAKRTRKPGKSRSLTIVQKFFPGVGTVRDGADDIEVEVTKRDVTTASKGNHSGCAMAVACTRAAHADGMIVSIATAYVIKGKVAYRYLVPPSVSREITSFDRGATFATGQYVLKAPPESLQLGSVHNQHGGSTHTIGDGKNAPRHLTDEIRAVLQGGKTRRAV